MAPGSVSSVEHLRQQLWDPVTRRRPEPAARAAIATALTLHAQDPDVVRLLSGLLRDPDPNVREAATAALADVFVARPAAVTEAVDIEKPDSAPRALYDAVARFTGRVGTREALDLLLATLDRSDSDSCEWVLDRVASKGAFSNELLLSRLRADKRAEPESAQFLARLLARRGVDEGHAFLIRDGSRVAIDDLIAQGPDGVRLLCRLAVDLDPDTQGDLTKRLAAQRKKTEATIHELLRDLSAPAGVTAAMTLGYWDEPQNVELLLSIAPDRGCLGDVREAALQALCRLEAPEAIDLLCEAMSDDQVTDHVRWGCADALGAIGNAAALPALEAVAAAHPEGTLGASARAAIQAIMT